jgi:hypothetical protein
MADGTLSQNSRELEDGEVIDVTELAPEGHRITQDVDDILDANHVPSSMVDEEELPLEQARAGTPPSPLPQNKGKGRARTPSEDSVIVRPRRATSRASRRDPNRDDDRPQRSRSTARPPRETRSRQSVAESDQCSEYSSTSHHSSYDMNRHVMLLRIVLIRRSGDSERTLASTNGLRPRCIAGPKYLRKTEERSKVGNDLVKRSESKSEVRKSEVGRYSIGGSGCQRVGDEFRQEET